MTASLVLKRCHSFLLDFCSSFSRRFSLLALYRCFSAGGDTTLKLDQKNRLPLTLYDMLLFRNFGGGKQDGINEERTKKERK